MVKGVMAIIKRYSIRVYTQTRFRPANTGLNGFYGHLPVKELRVDFMDKHYLVKIVSVFWYWIQKTEDFRERCKSLKDKYYAGV